jgi:hypothetical protein
LDFSPSLYEGNVGHEQEAGRRSRKPPLSCWLGHRRWIECREMSDRQCSWWIEYREISDRHCSCWIECREMSDRNCSWWIEYRDMSNLRCSWATAATPPPRPRPVSTPERNRRSADAIGTATASATEAPPPRACHDRTPAARRPTPTASNRHASSALAPSLAAGKT